MLSTTRLSPSSSLRTSAYGVYPDLIGVPLRYSLPSLPFAALLPDLSFQRVTTIKSNHPTRIVRPERSEGSLRLFSAQTAKLSVLFSFQQVTIIKFCNSPVLITIQNAPGYVPPSLLPTTIAPNSPLYFQSLPRCSSRNPFPFMLLHCCPGVVPPPLELQEPQQEVRNRRHPAECRFFPNLNASFSPSTRESPAPQDLLEVTDSMQNFFLGKHFILGKHFVFGFCAVFLLTFGPVCVACAQHWWQHTGPGPMGAGADQKAESTSKHAGKAQLEKPTPLYTSPKSVGWWYKTPAPMGAGANQNFFFNFNLDSNFKWTKPHFRRAQHEKLTPLYTSPKSIGWWYKTPAPMGAGADQRFYFYSKWTWPHM